MSEITSANTSKPALTVRHPTIAEETGLLNVAVSLVNEAVAGARSGLPSKDCGTYLAGARILHGISRQSIAQRISAGRLAMQEAKLIEAEKSA